MKGSYHRTNLGNLAVYLKTSDTILDSNIDVKSSEGLVLDEEVWFKAYLY